MNAASKKYGRSGLPSLADSYDDASWAPTEVARTSEVARSSAPTPSGGVPPYAGRLDLDGDHLRLVASSPSPFASSNMNFAEPPARAVPSPFATSVPDLARIAPRPERTVLMPNAPRLLAVAAVPRKRAPTKRTSKARQALLACAVGVATFVAIVGTSFFVLYR